jgi:hypothetical protein
MMIAMNQPIVIHVNLSQYNGGYVAVGKNYRGLFVSHSSIEKVLQTIPSAIKLLFKADHGVDVKVRQATVPPGEVSGVENIDFVAEAA